MTYGDVGMEKPSVFFPDLSITLCHQQYVSDHNIYSGSGLLLLMCILYITAQYVHVLEDDENDLLKPIYFFVG